MCDFISWIDVNNTIIFLTDDIVKKRLNEYKKYNRNWKEDIKGHGAIRWFYNDLKGGINKECADFSSPNNFPKEIVEAIKSCEFKLIGYNINLLNDKGRKEYIKIKQLAWEEYIKITQPAWEEYIKITQPAREEYDKIKQLAWEEYDKIKQLAWEEYIKITQPAREEYDKKEQLAWEEYDKKEQQSFWKLFKDINNRREEWR